MPFRDLYHGAEADKLLFNIPYVAKYRVDIPDGTELARASTSGNPDARILKIEPGAQVRAQVLELNDRVVATGKYAVHGIRQ